LLNNILFQWLGYAFNLLIMVMDRMILQMFEEFYFYSLFLFV